MVSTLILFQPRSSSCFRSRNGHKQHLDASARLESPWELVVIITLQLQEPTGNVLQTGLDGQLLDPEQPMPTNGSHCVVVVVVVVHLLPAAVLPILAQMEHAALNMVIVVLVQPIAELDAKLIVDLLLPEVAVLPILAQMEHAALNMVIVVLVQPIAELDAKQIVMLFSMHEISLFESRFVSRLLRILPNVI